MLLDLLVLLLHFLMSLLSEIAHTLCLFRLLWRFKLDTTLLNPLKMLLDNVVRIEPYNRRLNLSLRVEHSRKGKRVSLDLIANSRIPCTIEVIDLKLPMFFFFELIDDILEVSAELAVWGEELYEFIGGVIIEDLLFVLDVADHSGVREVPFLAVTQGGQQ